VGTVYSLEPSQQVNRRVDSHVPEAQLKHVVTRICNLPVTGNYKKWLTDNDTASISTISPIQIQIQ